MSRISDQLRSNREDRWPQVYMFQAWMLISGILLILEGWLINSYTAGIFSPSIMLYLLGLLLVIAPIIFIYTNSDLKRIIRVGKVIFISSYVFLVALTLAFPAIKALWLNLLIMLGFAGYLLQNFRNFVIFGFFGGISASILRFELIPYGSESFVFFLLVPTLLILSGVLVYYRDNITTQLRRVNELHEGSPIPVLEVHLNGNIRYANRAAYEMFPDLLHNDTPIKLVHETLSLYHQLSSQNTNTVFNIDSENKAFQVTVQADVQDQNLWLFIQDISWKKTIMDTLREREELLQEREEVYRIMVEGTNEALIVVDVKGRISFVNHQFCKLFGYAEAEIIGRDAAGLLVDGSDPTKIAKRLSERLAGKSEVYEATQMTKSGEELWTLISASPYRDRTGQICGTVAAITDLSPLKKAREDLEERNQQMDMFLYKATHDLKGPLASVKGILTLALQYCEQDTVRKYVDMAVSCTDRLDNAVIDLLKVARMNNESLSVEEVSLKHVVSDIIESLDHLEERKGVHIETEINYDRPFFTDRVSLNSILQNLILNSLKYKREEASPSWVRVMITEKKQGILIEVTDNGEGIRDDVKEKVFQMFYRGNKKSKGTGLGLYIVKHSVEKMKGKVSLESEAGTGTSFRLYLPDLNPEKANQAIYQMSRKPVRTPA